MKIINFRDVVTNFKIGGISKQKVTFYAKRLSKETSARRLASVLMIGLLVFQLITFVAPPQKSSAAGTDIVPGGFSSISQLLSQYDNNAGHLHEIMDSIGINRDDLATASGATWTCVNGLLSMGYGGGGTPSVNGTTVGSCTDRWAQSSIGGIKINRKIFADIGVGAQWYEIGVLNTCDNLVFLPTSPPVEPTPEPTFACANLNYTASSTTVGGVIGFTGYANGQNVTDNDLVNMDYQLTDVNDVPLSTQTAAGVHQQGGVYTDPTLRVFSFPNAGTYKMRLWVHYNNNGQDAIATGSAQGSCLQTVTVNTERSLQCAQLDIVTKTGQAPFTPGLRGATRVIGDSGATPYPTQFTYILLHKIEGAPPVGAPVINYQGINYLEGNPTGGPSRITHANSNPAVYTDPASGPAFFATDFAQTSPGDFLIIFRSQDQNGVGTPENPSNCYVPFTVSPQPSAFLCKSLKAVPASGVAPLPDVVLTAEAGVNNAAVQSYQFDFGDGNKQTVNSSALTASSAKHTYQNAGTYTATVTIVTNKGSTDPNSCKTTVTVTPPIFVCKSLTANPDSGPIPLEVTFNGTATVSNAKVQSFEFDFGDGNKQTVNTDMPFASIKHTYQSPGKFTASIIVKTDKGTAPATDSCKTPITPTDVRFTKNVANLTLLTVDGKPTDANNQVAKAGDTLRYQIAVCNASGAPVKGFVFEDNVTDILYYADLADLGGATKVTANGQTNLVWPPTDIAPLPNGQACADSSGNLITANFATAVRTFTVKIKDPIPASPGAAADSGAYDCQVQDKFHGTVVVTPIGVIPAKQLECAAQKLPQTGAGAPIFFIAFFAASSAFLFFRNRLLKRELKLVETLSGDEGGTT